MIGSTAGLGKATGIRLGLVNSAPHPLCFLPSPRFLVLFELHKFLVPPGEPGHLDLRSGNVPILESAPAAPCRATCQPCSLVPDPLPRVSLGTVPFSVPSEIPPTQINDVYFQIICISHPERSFSSVPCECSLEMPRLLGALWGRGMGGGGTWGRGSWHTDGAQAMSVEQLTLPKLFGLHSSHL